MTKEKKTRLVNWMKYRKLYFGLSLTLTVISIFSLLTWSLLIGLEFRGGTEVVYRSSTDLSGAQFEEVNSIQEIGENQFVFRMSKIDQEGRSALFEKVKSLDEGAEELTFQQVGPSVGPELVKKTLFAIAISAGSILLWVAYQFKSIKFGASAILAMAHDSFILLGSFSLLGHFFGAEADFLFVTAVLTTLSFSVHDTIVVFDRIREIRKKHGGEIETVANRAVSETMRRSVVNSLTIIFMLLALVILGGASIRWFAGALLIGAVLGTYSSPFVAVPLLVVFNNIKKIKR